MNLWTIVDTVVDLIDLAEHWRFFLCLVAGIAAAAYIMAHLSTEPLNWALAGAALVISVVIGFRWERSS